MIEKVRTCNVCASDTAYVFPCNLPFFESVSSDEQIHEWSAALDAPPLRLSVLLEGPSLSRQHQLLGQSHATRRESQ